MKKYEIIATHAISDQKSQKIKREFESIEKAFAILETEGYRDIRIKELKKTSQRKLFGHIHCPVNGWDCPYYKDGKCTMYPKQDPIEQCDDFAYFFDVEDDYICYKED